jgi:hypothetical protein
MSPVTVSPLEELGPCFSERDMTVLVTVRDRGTMTNHADVLARLAKVVVNNASERPLTWRLCEACRFLLGADSAAITIENTHLTRLTLAATDELAARLEDLQDVLGQGPSRDAFLSGTAVVVIPGDELELKWPLFTEARRELAATASIFALPMRPSETVFGVLTLIRQDRGSLTEDLSTAQFLSDAVGAALIKDPLPYADFAENGPWSQRSQIHQATGMVAAQLRVDAEDAMALLRAHAYAHDEDLLGVALRVLKRRLDFGPTEEGGTDDPDSGATGSRRHR